MVETDKSILVKHRECVSSHYKEASIERFNLNFYGIKLPNASSTRSDDKDITGHMGTNSDAYIIRQGLTEYIEDI